MSAMKRGDLDQVHSCSSAAISLSIQMVMVMVMDSAPDAPVLLGLRCKGG